MRIFQVFYDALPRKRARGGTEVGMYQTFRALVELGHEVELVICGGPYDLEPEIRRAAWGVHWLTPRVLRPLERFGARVFHPDTWRMRAPDRTGFATQLRQLTHAGGIDLVWADDFYAISVAPRGDVPTIYGHYDFLHLLKPVRAATRPRPDLRNVFRGRQGWSDLRATLHRPDALTLDQLQRIELAHCRETSLVVSVSPTVVSRLAEQGVAAECIPVVGGETIARRTERASGPLRLFLFGNNNTSNRAILREIRDRLHPMLAARGVPVEWHHVGTVKPHEVDEDWRWAHASFTRVHGFVEDLTSVMQPGDISVVAYPFDTGARAKFAITAGHGIISAGYPTAFATAPEFRPGVDCIVGANAEALVEELASLATDVARRRSLSEAVRETYEAHFTFEAQLPRFAQALERTRSEHARRVSFERDRSVHQ